MDTEIKSKRGGWGSNFGFLMASIGSAVGLGNIWGFPYKMGKSGGAVFLLLLQKLFGDAEFLRHSRALPYFNSLISQVRGWLPPDLISRFGL